MLNFRIRQIKKLFFHQEGGYKNSGRNSPKLLRTPYDPSYARRTLPRRISLRLRSPLSS